MDTLFKIMRTLHEINIELLDELIDKVISTGRIRQLQDEEFYAVYMTVHGEKPNTGKNLAQFRWGVCVTSPTKPFKDPFQSGMWGAGGMPTPYEMSKFIKYRDAMGLRLLFPIIGDAHYPHVGHIEGSKGVGWAAHSGRLQGLKKWMNRWVDVTSLTHLYTIYPAGMHQPALVVKCKSLEEGVKT